MKKVVIAVCLALSIGSFGCAPSTSRVPVQAERLPTAPEVRNIILMIADGAGPGLWNAAAYASDDLAVRTMRVGGIVDTRSARHRVIDSAASAATLATGELVVNRTISMGPTCSYPRYQDTVVVAAATGCEPLETWFEVARAKGRATGLVTTTSIVDATPAAFVAHAPSRYYGDMIAEQMVNAELDVLLGGGRDSFMAEGRNDRRDLLTPLCARSDCFFTESQFASYAPSDRPLVGLFAHGDMDDEEPRSISFPTMVTAALAKLERHPGGFVAMFETESTDNFTHDNAELEVITAAILEFDEAVRVVLDFARRTPGTLVIVTGDHETGGVALVEAGLGVRLSYANTDHTSIPVPLFAEGPKAERFGGFHHNYEIGRLLMDIVRRWEPTIEE